MTLKIVNLFSFCQSHSPYCSLEIPPHAGKDLFFSDSPRITSEDWNLFESSTDFHVTPFYGDASRWVRILQPSRSNNVPVVSTPSSQTRPEPYSLEDFNTLVAIDYGLAFMTAPFGCSATLGSGGGNASDTAVSCSSSDLREMPLCSSLDEYVAGNDQSTVLAGRRIVHSPADTISEEDSQVVLNYLQREFGGLPSLTNLSPLSIRVTEVGLEETVSIQIERVTTFHRFGNTLVLALQGRAISSPNHGTYNVLLPLLLEGRSIMGSPNLQEAHHPQRGIYSGRVFSAGRRFDFLTFEGTQSLNIARYGNAGTEGCGILMVASRTEGGTGFKTDFFSLPRFTVLPDGQPFCRE